MIAVFDKNCNCVAWYDVESGNVFDSETNWIGFVRDGYFFSRTAGWLGGFVNGSYLDRKGKPVGWLKGSTPCSTQPLNRPLRPLRPLTPLRPLRPLAPLRPLCPLTPLGGWSNLTWNEYVNQE